MGVGSLGRLGDWHGVVGRIGMGSDSKTVEMNGFFETEKAGEAAFEGRTLFFPVYAEAANATGEPRNMCGCGRDETRHDADILLLRQLGRQVITRALGNA